MFHSVLLVLWLLCVWGAVIGKGDFVPNSNPTASVQQDQENDQQVASANKANDAMDPSDGPSEAPREKKHLTPMQIIKRGLAIAAGIVVCVLLIGSSLAGQLSVAVLSQSGTFTGEEAEVALYKDNVNALLTDDDPLNDPEPVAVKSIVIGQRAAFNMSTFGEHTLMLTLLDEGAASRVSIEPINVTMWGIDMRQTYEIA